VKVIQGVDKQFNETVKKLAGDVPLPEEVTWEPPEGIGNEWPQPLPPQVFAKLAMFSQVMQEIGPEYGKKYSYEPTELVDDTSLRAAQAKMKMAAKDKKLAQALQAPAGAPEGAPPPGEQPPPVPPGPGEMSEEEETIMGAA
jgi:hypothetical protein